MRRARVSAVRTPVPREAAARLRARGLQADHTTLWRWVQRYGLELKAQPRRPLPPDQTSWHVDETTVRVKGRWWYLYRALDATGTPIDFVLSEVPAAAAATRLFRTALTDPSATAAGHHHAGLGGRRRRRAVAATPRALAAGVNAAHHSPPRRTWEQPGLSDRDGGRCLHFSQSRFPVATARSEEKVWTA